MPADLLFLVGPTAVGKTAVAIEMAPTLGAEILSVDSRQCYRGCDIGTAKPSAAERERVRHHLVDLFDPREAASAQAFAGHFRTVLTELKNRDVRALAVGGSGLYVDACLGRLDPLPPADPAIRAAHERLRDTEGAPALHQRLQQVDPASAARLPARDFQRVSRALEVFELTGIPMSRQQKGGVAPDLSHDPRMILLLRSRADLYQRIADRAHSMLAEGLLAEVERLVASGVALSSPAMEAIGYGEFGRVLAGEISLEAATELFVRRTRQYARRQITWFRNRYQGTCVIEIPVDERPKETAQRCRHAIGEVGG